MSDGFDALGALPIAVADLAVGGILARHVSIPLGTVLAVAGVLVLCTVAYRTVRRADVDGSQRRRPA
ncbi:MAG: hypothetical protein V5A62_14750 [Haloarculaceae archaeon]